MTGGAPVSDRVRPYFGVLRARRPGVAGWFDRLRVRSATGAAEEIARLHAQVLELQRDQRLLAAHVAALTGRLQEPRVEPPEVSEEARERAVQAARLSAIAFYEHRIARLERALPKRRGSGAAGEGDG